MNDRPNEAINSNTEIKYFFYEEDGKIVGPTDPTRMQHLVINEKLRHDTLLWEINDTEWKKFGEKYKTDQPPPLPISHIPNGYAVTLSVMPFIQIWLLNYIDRSFGSEFTALKNYSPTLFGVVAFLFFFITANSMLIADFVSLGRKNIKINSAIYLTGNLIPTYLFYRGTLIARSNGKSWHASHLLAFVWIICANYAYKLNLF